MKNFADEQLVKNYLRGNEKALEELVQRYLLLIYNFSRRYAAIPITLPIFLRKFLSKFGKI